MGDPSQDRAADDLVRRCRELAAAGLVPAASGNASVRCATSFLITATGARFAEMSVEDLVLVDASGRVVEGVGRPSSEIDLHLRTYALRPDVGAVVHTHGRHAVALSTVLDSVPALHYYCLELGGEIAVAPYRTFGTPELADVTTAALGAAGGVVMAHHGGLCVGPDLATASERAELLEWLCEVALLAGAVGSPRVLGLPDLDEVRRRSRRHRERAGGAA